VTARGGRSRIRVSRAQRANQRGDAFSVAGDQVRAGRGATEDVRLAGRADDLRRLLGDMPRGPAVHVCLVPDQVAHLPPGTRRNARGQAGGLRGVREQPAISFYRRDVLSDLHLMSLREILLSVSRLSPVPRSRGGRTVGAEKLIHVTRPGGIR
jgi:hypothetical protein